MLRKINVIDKDKKRQKFSNIFLLAASPERGPQQDTVADLFLFLLRYPFLLNDTSKPQNSCVQKTPQLNAPQGNIYMGARYLDPKYSRWISVDPALGEYASGSLVGGGIFDYANFNLYHYAGNNPIRYNDPTGQSKDDWQYNGDGTWTVKSEGAKLWDIYGADWREKSGYEGDPTKLQIGDTVGKKRNYNLGWQDAPSELKQQVAQGNAQKLNQTRSTPQNSTNLVLYGGFGGKAALILGLGGETGFIADIDMEDKSIQFYFYLSGSIGCGIQTPAVTKTNLSPEDYLNKAFGPTGSITLNSSSIVTSLSTTADICLGINGIYDLNNLKSSGLPNTWSFGSIGGGIWKTWFAAIPLFKIGGEE